MACQTEAGHIRHGMGYGRKNGRCRADGVAHRSVAGGDGFAQDQAGQAGKGHLGGKDGAAAQGLGQDQHIAGARAALGQRAVGQAGDGEADGQFAADGRMPTDDGRPRIGKDAGGGLHDFGQHVLLQFGGKVGQDDLRQRRLRGRAHGPDIAKRMDGGDFRQQAGILGEAAQVVGGQHLPLGAEVEDGRIIAGAVDKISAVRAGEVGDRVAKRPGPDLGPASGAEGLRCHHLRQALDRFRGHGRLCHGRVIGEFRHELAVDAVLQPPEPGTPAAQAELVGHGAAFAQRDELQIVALRAEAPHPSPCQRRAQVVRQDRRGPDGIDAGLGARGEGHVDAIPGGEDRGVRGLQGRRDGQETVGHVKAGRRQPWLRLAACGGEGEVRAETPPILQDDRAIFDSCRFGTGQQQHPCAVEFGQQALPCSLADMGQGAGTAFQQGDGRSRAGLSQAVGRGEGEFDAADACRARLTNSSQRRA